MCLYLNRVAPYAGAWIEIVTVVVFWYSSDVAPYAGAWIEILTLIAVVSLSVSLLMQERGLKFENATFSQVPLIVAPYAGAWIEILTTPLST